MAKLNINKKSPLFIVIVIAIVLLVIMLCLMIASRLVMQSQNNWLANETKKINEQNEKLIADYNLKKSEFEKSLVIDEEKDRPQPNSEGWDIVDYSEFPLENAQAQTINRAEFLSGPLMLANAWHPLPQDYEPTIDPMLVSIGSTTGASVQVQNYSLKLFKPAVESIIEMLKDASQEGHAYYIIREAFRSNATQTELYEKARARLADKYSGEILKQEVLKSVNYPGTSEYQTGYTVRFGLYNKENPEIAKQAFQESEQGKWLTDNSWKYGFVFRFPVSDFPDPSWIDKSYLTGVSVKLNAYRYVGKANALIMHMKEYVLEEYLEYLMEHPHLRIYENGNLKYEITRTLLSDPNAQSAEVMVPFAARNITHSYDNLGGIISVFEY